jgi:hypothetical protein
MKVKLIQTQRNGKVSLWIKIPKSHDRVCNEWNIWDLTPEKVTPDVLHAIVSAFKHGAMFQRMAYHDAELKIPSCFEETKPCS